MWEKSRRGKWCGLKHFVARFSRSSANEFRAIMSPGAATKIKTRPLTLFPIAFPYFVLLHFQHLFDHPRDFISEQG